MKIIMADRSNQFHRNPGCVRWYERDCKWQATLTHTTGTSYELVTLLIPALFFSCIYRVALTKKEENVVTLNNCGRLKRWGVLIAAEINDIGQDKNNEAML